MSNNKPIQKTAAYKCPHCKGRISKLSIDDGADLSLWSWQCEGCLGDFGSPWWGNEKETILVGFEPWEGIQREKTPLGTKLFLEKNRGLWCAFWPKIAKALSTILI